MCMCTYPNNLLHPKRICFMRQANVCISRRTTYRMRIEYFAVTCWTGRRLCSWRRRGHISLYSRNSFVLDECDTCKWDYTAPNASGIHLTSHVKMIRIHTNVVKKKQRARFIIRTPSSYAVGLFKYVIVVAYTSTTYATPPCMRMCFGRIRTLLRNLGM